MDRLIDAIEVELDRAKRKALWQRLQALYTEDLPVIPLYWRANAYVLPKWLETACAPPATWAPPPSGSRNGAEQRIDGQISDARC